jgi:uncharacterized protein YndB with AHSA1/START domain
LVVRRTIKASAEKLFEAWTEPAMLMQWWGPRGVTCTAAEVELRVGGRFRLANQFPDGKVLWITGEYRIIEAPRRLAYTWSIEPATGNPEYVTVSFEPRAGATEVIVTHERIATIPARDMHEQGWFGCLDGLVDLLEQDSAPA